MIYKVQLPYFRFFKEKYTKPQLGL